MSCYLNGFLWQNVFFDEREIFIGAFFGFFCGVNFNKYGRRIQQQGVLVVLLRLMEGSASHGCFAMVLESMMVTVTVLILARLEKFFRAAAIVFSVTPLVGFDVGYHGLVGKAARQVGHQCKRDDDLVRLTLQADLKKSKENRGSIIRFLSDFGERRHD
jgi:hypothetical protein